MNLNLTNNMTENAFEMKKISTNASFTLEVPIRCINGIMYRLGKRIA